jgi:preprotein translocase subunit SecB
MTDQTAPQNNGQPGIQVVAQYIKDLSFENPNAPESLVAGWPAPDTGVEIAMRHQALRDNMYECIIHFRVEAKKKDDKKTCFIVDLSYAALVVLHNIPKENHQPAMMIEVPKLMFPFARQIIADATSQGGYPPLFLSPINFEGLYVAELKKLQADKGKTANN